MARTPDDPRYDEPRGASRRSPEDTRTDSPERGRRHNDPADGNGRHRRREDEPRGRGAVVEERETPAVGGNGAGIAAFVVGLLGLTLAFFVVPALAAVVMGIAAIILGIVGARNAGRMAGLHKGLSITGVVTGALALLLGGAVIVGGIALVDDLQQQIQFDELEQRLDAS